MIHIYLSINHTNETPTYEIFIAHKSDDRKKIDCSFSKYMTEIPYINTIHKKFLYTTERNFTITYNVNTLRTSQLYGAIGTIECNMFKLEGLSADI